MKRKIPVLIGLAVLALIVLLSACAPSQAETKLDQFEEKAEQQLEAALDPIIPVSKPAKPTMLTSEDAKAIAVAHAGLTGQQISRLRAVYEIDDRIPHYDVEFYHNGTEYDYEIHAETGKILSFDQDRN